MPKVSSKKFFRQQTVQSLIKARIVASFFVPWAAIVLKPRGTGSLPQAAFVDLFCGPGSYEDGSRSTPLLVAEHALRTTACRERMHLFFNDEDEALVASLKQEIGAIDNIGTLRHPPRYSNEVASIDLIDRLAIPSESAQFYFLDQFGYSDVSPKMIQRVFRARRCDAALFFRTSRVIAALSNPKTRVQMETLFGSTYVDLAAAVRNTRSIQQKETLVLDAWKKVCSGVGAPVFKAFPFRIHEERSAKHHLIYLGKHDAGLPIITDIMAKASSRDDAGVATMGYAEVGAHPNLFERNPIDDLENELPAYFAGKTLKVGQVFLAYHDRAPRCSLANFQEAIKKLEAGGKVIADPPASLRPTRNGKTTLATETLIGFPE